MVDNLMTISNNLLLINKWFLMLLALMIKRAVQMLRLTKLISLFMPQMHNLLLMVAKLISLKNNI